MSYTKDGRTMRELFRKMPPKTHNAKTELSEVVAHIQETLGCEMDRALKAFNSMRNHRSGVVVFDFVNRAWKGCDWCPQDEVSAIEELRRDHRALAREVASLKSFIRKSIKKMSARTRKESKESEEPHQDVPETPVMSCNPGDQSREFAKLFEKEREEARCMKATERLEESGPRRWLGCCDGCGYPELIGTQYPYECGDCGLPYTERGQ